MKFIVLGSNGRAGWNLLHRNENYIGTFHKSEPKGLTNHLLHLDVTNFQDVHSTINRLRPDIVINCTGLTNVDFCEEYPEAAYWMNTKVPRFLSSLSLEFDFHFIQLSTDHFASHKDMFSEMREFDTDFFPVNVYGFTKLSMERQVSRCNPKVALVRTNFFGFSQSRDSFFDNVIENTKLGIEFDGFSDVIFNPVSNSHLVSAITRIAEDHLSGVFHVTSREPISKFRFAELTVSMLDRQKEIVRKVPANFRGATRPRILSLEPSIIEGVSNDCSISDMIALELSRYPEFN